MLKKIPPITALRLVLVAAAILLAVVFLPKSSFFPRTAYGPILHEEESEFSHIRVRGNASNRHLLFVSDLGKEGLQSSIDLKRPDKLQVAYSRVLFASLLFRCPQNRVLIIGLGGGGMVRFIEQRLPETEVDAVEIDPAVVRIAAEFFETEASAKIAIHTEDAFVYFEKQRPSYDAIYLDAFLRPSVDRETDSKTARLKTVEFLHTVRDQLSLDGVLACNLISHRSTTAGDLAALHEVFASVREFPVAGTGNLVVIATRTEIPESKAELISRAGILEKMLPIGLPFSEYAKTMREK
jgi:spermidine synthase